MGRFVVIPLLTVLLLLSPSLGWAQDGTRVFWTEVAPFVEDGAETGLAYDSHRERVVLFVGHRSANNETLSQTWEWDGARWERRAVGGPSPRLQVHLTYDSARRKTVLFGGVSPEGDLSEIERHVDTWEWDGVSWTEIQTSNTPIDSLGSIAYDRARERVVFLNAFDGRVYEYDGVDWTRRESPVQPGRYASLVYDERRAQVLAAGGLDVDFQEIVDGLWAWDGLQWTRLGGAGPTKRVNACLAYDSAREVVVLFGGVDSTPRNDTWEWDGTSWHKRVPKRPPRPRVSPKGCAFDAARERLVLFDGSVDVGGVIDGEARNTTWLYDGAVWERINEYPGLPASRQGAAGTFFEPTGQLLIFGGQTVERGATDDFWAFGANEWQRMNTAPPARSEATMAAPGASATGSPPVTFALLFGGRDATGKALGDTWLYTGSTWQEVIGAGPAARWGHSLAYRPQSESFILFGGTNGETWFEDTWEFRNGSWAEVSVSGTRPRARTGAGFALLPPRDVALTSELVLFGGTDGVAFLDDAWIFDGASWRQLPTDAPSAVLSDHVSLVHDARTQNTLLTRGDEVWRLDIGSGLGDGDVGEWTAVTIAAPGLARSAGVTAWDSERRRLLVYGGLLGEFPRGEVLAASFYGGPCGELSPSDCPGSCVDGVCCQSSSCATCEACNLPGNEGVCAPVAEGAEDDSCGVGQVCTAQGGCITAGGFACNAGEFPCPPGYSCTDGVCCNEAACAGECRSCNGVTPGVCSAVINSQDFDSCVGNRICNENAECRTVNGVACTTQSECNSGRCELGQCVASAASVCDGDHTLRRGSEGETDCAPFRCDGDLDICLTACTRNSECAGGSVCSSEGVCTSDTVTASNDSGFCSLDGSRDGGLPLLPLAALLAALGWRRRRPWLLALALGLTLWPRSVAAQSASGRPVWTEVEPWLSDRALPGFAYDAARERLTLFGGGTLALSSWLALQAHGDTWVFEDGDWRRLELEQAPSPRLTAMEYFPPRKHIVLFGGADESRVLSDTWTFDGNAWRQRLGTSPAPRFQHSMAYDPSQELVVLYGGNTGPVNLAQDTWGWDGFGWNHLGTGGPPLGVIEYDRKQEQLILVGANPAVGLLDTHVWNGAVWELAKPGSLASGPQLPATLLVYDEASQHLVLCGGPQSSQCWSWTGADWQSLPTSGVVGDIGVTGGTAWDARDQRIVQFGGMFSDDPLATLFDTWFLEDTVWTRHQPSTPEPREYASVAHDPQRGETWLTNGWVNHGNSAEYMLDAWIFDGSWREAPPVPDTGLHSMVFDAGREQMLAFGGVLLFTNQLVNQTWSWDGDDWVELSPPTSPPPLRAGRLVYDSARDRVVLFGGATSTANTPTLSDETWEWDGTTWLQRDVEPHPSARWLMDLAYDAHRQRTVLFGGIREGTAGGTGLVTGESDETWEWDGERWELRSPMHSPPARGFHAMAYDARRQRVVLVGGLSSQNFFHDVWEWDGNDWTQLDTAMAPGARNTSGLVFDTTRNELLLIGGIRTTSSTPLRLHAGGLWSYTVIGNACLDASRCSTGSCIDNVCCEQSACGTCEACDLPGTEGECAQVAASAQDPDSCAGNLQCDAVGACVVRLGSPCEADTDCFTENCVDGVCCSEPACAEPCSSCATTGG